MERFDDPTKQVGRIKQLLHQLVVGEGLEADVVILVDIQFNSIDPHLYYVGATRAKHRLFVLGW